MSSLGNVLVACSGAQPESVGPGDRPRFVTAGALMLLTAGLATYAGAAIAGMGLHRSVWSTLPFGLFWALLIFFLDRSVLLSPRPYRCGRDGSVRVGGPGAATAMRVFIAICAALLVGEALLLTVFASSIAPRVTEIRQEELGRALRGFDANQRSEEQTLAAGVATRQQALEAAHRRVAATTVAANCQLTGSGGCLAGAGPIYRIALADLGAAAAAVTTASQERDAAQARLDTFDRSRDARRSRFLDAQTATTDAADDLLTREKAFWRLTTSDHSVLFWRIVLTLLLLGVDLGPLSFARTLEQTDCRRRDRLERWRTSTAHELEAQQIACTTRHRARLARELADAGTDRYGQYVRRRDEVEIAVHLAGDLAAADVARAEIRADRDSRIRELRARHRVPDPASPADPSLAPAAGLLAEADPSG
ncbi:DUF4407 domain-containing protein [Frankia sp. AiPs1]|uniref:DUF4407 domain-containing protein n=1 Tax=Frankia sp. AiPa1 TaxID=573492 RepID=UPI00202AD28C|nr:DUF4407 domain-containing protein [Frankia sp. AiPa1]MCL9762897.1 DUF4407 domain-containing protein [Frankia sp. AiPa1]